MENKLEYILVNNFKCKRCGCNKYDKIFYTGDKLLDENDAIITTRYVCRNCNFPFNINDFKELSKYESTPKELLNNSIYINENEKENKNE